MMDKPTTSGRVTKLKCPVCGTGEWNAYTHLHPAKCLWCEGSGWLPAEKCRSYVSWLRILGDGGYLAGDHDWNDRQEFLAKASKIESYLQPAEGG